MSKTKLLNIRIDPDLKKKAKKLAEADGRSLSNWVTKLIASDVGRPITDIASALLYPELAEDAREVLRKLTKVERQISTPEGTWFEARILPYRTLENMIDGVVITFSDITVTKKLEAVNL